MSRALTCMILSKRWWFWRFDRNCWCGFFDGMGWVGGWVKPGDIVEMDGGEFLICAAFDDIVGFSAERFIRSKVFSGRNFIF
jgi:hypothetical protein